MSKPTSKFATDPDCTDTDFNLTCQLDDIIMDSNNGEPQRNHPGGKPEGKLILFSDQHLHIFDSGMRESSYKFQTNNEKVRISACATAELVGKSLTPLVYVAKANKPLELTHPFRKPLLTFSTIGERTKMTGDQITSLKAVVTPAGDRLGVLVSRRCGLLQLWDDRWPNMPAVQYPESKASNRLCTLSSHIPIQPIVGSLFNWNTSVVACPLLGSSCIVLWELSTGEPLNVLQPPSTNDNQPPPPQVFLRSTWPNSKGLPRRGPAVISVEQCALHCFYEP